MNAIEFVKKYGIDRAKQEISYKGTIMQCNNSDGILDGLEEIIDAFELVRNFGGLKRAKRILKKSYTQLNVMVSVVWNDKPFQCTIEQLEQAINLVEQCQ